MGFEYQKPLLRELVHYRQIEAIEVVKLNLGNELCITHL